MSSQYEIEQLIKVAESIVYSDSKEFNDYIDYCDNNELEPRYIHGEEQSKHIYALALAGLGLDLEVKEGD